MNNQLKDVGSRAVRKASLRLLPLLFIAYLASFLNRVNIGFALTMKHDVGLSNSLFGLGAGLFFVGYFLFEVPSNVILARVGARRWIARIMLSWGVLSGCMALVRGPTSFLILRFFLGVAEAGFFPGVLLYITYWFPAAYRARTIALFMVAIPASLALGGPISNAIVHLMGNAGGLATWQWLFIIEAAPTVLLALVVYRWLPDRPRDATWLDTEERDWLERSIAAEKQRIEAAHPLSLVGALTDRRVLALSFIYFANLTTNLGIAFFLPSIIVGLGATATEANYVSAVPFVCGIGGVLAFGYLADRFPARRRQFLVVTLLMSAFGLGAAGLVGATPVSIALIGVASIGIYGAKGPFWPMPSLFLTGTAAAGGIGLINSIGNLGGFVGPYIMGRLKDLTGSYSPALYALAALATAAVFVLLLVIPRHDERRATLS